MPRSHRHRWLTLCAAAVLLAGGRCADPRPLRIAVAMNDDALPGARAAAEAVNAAGGIGGRPLELVVVPAQNPDANQTIASAEQLSADRTVLAVVGHGSSASSVAASQVYNARGLVQITPTSTATLLARAGSYTFRMVPTDANQAAYLADVALRLGAGRSAVIVYENDDYGRALRQELSRELEARGVRLVASLPYLANTGQTAMELIPQRLVQAGPEVVFWLGREEEKLAEGLPALHRLLPGVPVLASDGVESPGIYENPAAFAGLRFVRFLDPASGDPCLDRFRGRTDAPAGGTTEVVLTHDAVVVLVEVLRAGARTRAAVRERLAQVGSAAPAAPGCGGPIRFDAERGVERPYLLARVDSLGVHAVAESR